MDYDQLFDADFRNSQEEKILGNQKMRRLRYRRAFNLISNLKLEKALDVGCATGIFASMLRWDGISRDVSGIDVSESAILSAQMLSPAIHFEVGNLTRIPFPESAFNLVSCLDVIYYLDDAGRKKAVGEIARVLKPEGWLLISTSWPRMTKTRTGTSYIKPRELLELLGDRFTFVREATTSAILGLGFLRSGVAMLMRKK